jgi:putative lipoic acid-binding regulatory protein
VSDSSESLLRFPCRFPIKAMGLAEPGFDDLVVAIVRAHAPDLHEGAVVTRPSKGGKWLSVTVTIQATSRAQLDAIYQALSDHEKVVMAL